MIPEQSIMFICDDNYLLFKEEKKGIYKDSGTIDNIDNNENINVFVDSEHFNLIPSSLFNETKIDSYLELTTNNTTGLTPVSNAIDQFNCILIWTLDESIKKKVIINSPGASFFHLLKLFLNEPIKQKNNPEIKLRFTKKSLYIICLIKGKLQIVNRFPITGNIDAIYYTMLCAEHTKMKNEKIILDVGGKYDDDLINQLKKYFDSSNITTSKSNSYESLLK